MKHTIGVAALILMAGLFFSCTEGDYRGSGGEGNFNLIDRTKTLNDKYIFVSGVTEKGEEVGLYPRQKVKKDKVSAPLSYAETGGKYTGNDIFAKVKVTVYASETTSDVFVDKEFTSVKFYAGSGLIEW